MRILTLIFFIFIFYSEELGSEINDKSLKINGCFCEGGIIIGYVKKNDNVEIDGKTQVILDDSYFIFAFGRKFKDTVEIKVNGIKEVFKVKKKKYKI